MVSARFPFYCSQWLNCGGTREAGSGVSMLRRAMQPLQSMFDDNLPTQTNNGTPRSMMAHPDQRRNTHINDGTPRLMTAHPDQ